MTDVSVSDASRTPDRRRAGSRRATLMAAGLRTGRQPVVGANGIVASPHPFATLTGIDVLRAGGNAVDATLAVSAALMVSVPHQCGPGGDAWFIVRPPDGPANVLRAVGRSSRHASADALREAGWRRMEEHDLRSVTVPGVAAGWAALHARHATRSLEELFRPAIDAATRGVTVSPYMARQLARADEMLRRDAAAAAAFRGGDGSLGVGDRLALPDLAASLAELAADPRSIYEGRLADGIVGVMRAGGGWIDAEDLAATEADWLEPLSATHGAWSILEAPPSSQGVTALIGLGIRERLAPTPADRVASLHAWIESARRAMAVRDAAVADPASMAVPAGRLLDEGVLAALASSFDPHRAASPSRIASVVGEALAAVGVHPPASDASRAVRMGTDTAHFAVVDRDGFAVSAIQSLFSAFGVGVMVPGTGILLHDRGTGFSLVEGHPNELRPRRRPMHTLAPAMGLDAAGRLAAVFGTMGGHAQAQLHLQMVDGLLGAGLDPATVTARPRWFARPDPVSGEPEVVVERRLRAAEGLVSLGHRLVRVGPYDEVVGHEQVVLVDQKRGALLGAADPRSDGLAMAW